MAKAERHVAYDVERLTAIIGDGRERSATTQDLVLDSLRHAILTGVIPPGARLRQEDLATVFGASRIPVREALRALEHEGLAASEPHRGFTVTTLDGDQVEEIYELRTVLEGHAIRLAIPLLTEHDIDELQALFDRMSNAADPDDELAYREQFYMRLFQVTARPRLIGLIGRLRQEVSRSLRWKLIQHSPRHHELFFEAIKNGETERAIAELADHYQKVVALLRRFLREGAGASSH